MVINKSKTAIALAATLGIMYWVPVSAELLIHTGGVETTLSQGLIGVGSHVTNLGTPFYLRKNVVGFGKDIPLSLAMNSLKPDGWAVLYNDDVKGEKPVSWSRSGNWNDVLGDIAKNNNLVAVIDWNAHTVRLTEMTPTGKNAEKAARASLVSADDSPFTRGDKNVVTVTKVVKRAKVNTVTIIAPDTSKKSSVNKLKVPSLVTKDMKNSIKLVDGLVYEQDADGCLSKKVNIEKMVMDTSWLGNSPKNELLSANKDAAKSHIVVEKTEQQKELENIAKDKARIAHLKSEYDRAYILSGNGSFQDFVNGGGIITKANNNSSYVYVYKKGTLFNTINHWSEKNGFIVKNDVFDKYHIDYENVGDVKLKGTFKEVATTVLSKYRNAKTPVMFTFYEAGGSRVLHIFESKYRSSYI